MTDPPPAPIAASLVEALRSARLVGVLTGAGVSAESGIPTFRDALTGIWSSYDPELLASPEGFASNPDLVWAWYRERRLAIGRAEPNAAHRALVHLQELVPRLVLVTQNIDGLHARLGSRDVIELHGNITRVKCSSGQHVVTEYVDGDKAPPCPHCGALLRPDVVWFGEMLPRQALERAREVAETCDVFLSVGTSNLIEPAASLPWIAARAGAVVAIVNTSLEGQRSGPAIHSLVGPAGQVLPSLLAATWP